MPWAGVAIHVQGRLGRGVNASAWSSVSSPSKPTARWPPSPSAGGVHASSHCAGLLAEASLAPTSNRRGAFTPTEQMDVEAATRLISKSP